MARHDDEPRRSPLAGLVDVFASVALVVAAAVRRSPTTSASAPEPATNGIRPVHVVEAEPPDGGPGWLRAIDRWQRRRPVTAFPFAVVKKFSDDRAGRLAALISYYGFFSLFPLLLVLVTIAGFVLGPEDAAELRDSALAQIPVVGSAITSGEGLDGSVLALVVGLATALWAGLGCMQAAQDAMNAVWNVPRTSQPAFLPKRLRSLLTLVLVGGALVVGTATSQVAALLPALAGIGRIAGVAVTVVVNVGVTLLAFQLLTVGHRSWRALLPGALVSGVGYTVLQFVGTFFVQRTVNANDAYGFFGIVLGLLSWLYLLAQLIIIAAEVNVVKAERLWPRGIVQDEPTRADQDVAAELTGAARLRKDAVVTVGFEDAPVG